MICDVFFYLFWGKSSDVNSKSGFHGRGLMIVIKDELWLSSRINAIIMARYSQLAKSYHVDIFTARRMIWNIVCAMTEGAIKMVSQKPFLQTLLMKDVEALQLADLLAALNLLQANRAVHTC